MISVTGYSKDGEPSVFGRHPLSEVTATQRAKEYAACYIEESPSFGPVKDWTFRRDTVDRQLFQPVRSSQ